MKVLLTGASGFIGGNVLRHLVKDGHDIYCPVHVSLDSNGRIDAAVGPGRVHTFQWDLTRPVMETASLRRVEVIINCAAKADVAESLASPRQHVDANVAMMINLLDLATRCESLDRLIHLSTNEVNDVRTPYGASKLAQEGLIHAWREAYGVPGVILTTRSVFGLGQQPTKFIPTVVRNLHAGKPVRLFGGLETERHWHHVANLVEDISTLLDRGNVNHFASYSDLPIRNVDVVQLIAEQLQVPAIFELVKDDGRYAAGEPEATGTRVAIRHDSRDGQFLPNLRETVRALVAW